MTAAGIALIAGGLATLICFRTVLFGGDRRRAQAGIQPKSRRARGNRRRNRTPDPVPVAPLPPARALGPAEEEDSRSGLALIGLADDPEPGYEQGTVEPYAKDQGLFPYGVEPVPDYEPEPEQVFGPAVPEPDMFGPSPAEPAGFEPDMVGPSPAEPVGVEPGTFPPAVGEPAYKAVGEPAYQEERYGHRVEGWVRPEYRHVPEEPPSGEYWTPIPVDLEPDPEPSAKGYGWPMAVERLPAAGDYEPPTGYDLAPVEHEPTEVVSAVPPARKRRDPVGDRANRIRLPRNWSARDDKYQEPAAREWRVENESPSRRRRADSTQRFAAVTDDPSPVSRRRPRPRPRPSVEPADRSTTMYVSRHAAEPPPR